MTYAILGMLLTSAFISLGVSCVVTWVVIMGSNNDPSGALGIFLFLLYILPIGLVLGLLVGLGGAVGWFSPGSLWMWSIGAGIAAFPVGLIWMKVRKI